MWPLIDVKAPFPRTEVSVRVDLRRQDVSIQPDLRRLVRKGELFGLSPRSKQRRLEADHRARNGLRDEAVFERIENSDTSRRTLS